MKARPLAGAGLLVFTAFAGLAAFQDRGEDPAGQVERLKKQVAALEDRVAKLETALQKITVSIPQGFPELKQLPKGWLRREFNGMPYYIIPIDAGAKLPSLEKR